jgi:hypothetical protein
MLRLTARIWTAPAVPASAPEIVMAVMMDLVVLSPAYFAARGFVPTVRKFSPQVVLKSSQFISQATNKAIKKAQVEANRRLEKLGYFRCFLDDGTEGHAARTRPRHRTREQPFRQTERYPVQHNGVDDLMPARFGFQETGDKRPERAA